MDLIQSYGDSDEEDNDEEMPDRSVVSNPEVQDSSQGGGTGNLANLPMSYNPTYEQLYATPFGPGGENPQNQASEQVEQYYMDDFTFNEAYYKSQRTRKRKIKKQMSTDDVEFDISDPNVKKKLLEKYEGFPTEALVIEEEEKESDKKGDEEEEEEEKVEHKPKRRKLISSQQHAKIRPGELIRPKGLRPTTKQKTRLPKKLAIHFKKAHTKGISRLLFFPSLGHLLLSGSVDSTIKLWDVHQRKKLIQTYFGYGQTVHDLAFSHNGSHFISAHGNGVIKVWDTERGKVVSEHIASDEIDSGGGSASAMEYNKPRKMVATCVKVNPKNEHEFIAGYRSNQVVQWDRRVNRHVRNYDKHQKSICDLLYIQQGTRFLSSSHDGSIRVWEYGNNEDSVRYISENYVKVALRLFAHPVHPFFLVQSITSNIFLFRIRDRDDYRLQGRRKFAGHKISRYPVRHGVSMDGKWIFTGDSEGSVFFWRWDDYKIKEVRRNVHQNVIMDCCWSPNHRSHFATCSWDGDIKMFK